MIPILHMSAMLVPAIVILILRQRCGTVKLSYRRLLSAILAGFFYLIFAALVTTHACDSGDPGRHILFGCICLGYVIARLRISFGELLTLCAALIALNLGVSVHYVKVIHRAQYTGNPRSTFVRPVESLWHSPLTGLYARRPFVIEPETSTETLLEVLPQLWESDQWNTVVVELEARSEDGNAATLIEAADIADSEKEWLLEELEKRGQEP